MVEDGNGAEALVQYDYLVLCTGTQYCLPGDLAVTENVFTVRDENQGARVLAWAKKELIPSGGRLMERIQLFFFHECLTMRLESLMFVFISCIMFSVSTASFPEMIVCRRHESVLRFL